MASKRKPLELGLGAKIDIIRQVEKGERIVDLEQRIGVSAFTIFTIMKNKDKILKAKAEENQHKRSKGGVGDLDRAILSWFHEQLKNNAAVSDLHIQKEAAKIAKTIGVYNFKASKVWLNEFNSRHRDLLSSLCFTYGNTKKAQDKNLDVYEVNDQAATSSVGGKLDLVRKSTEKQEEIQEDKLAVSASPMAEQKENKYEDLASNTYLLDEDSVEYIVIKEEHDESEEEVQIYDLDIKEEPRDDIEKDQGLTISPTTVQHIAPKSEPPPNIQASSSTHSNPSVIIEDVSPPTQSGSSISSSTTEGFAATANAEPPPSIQQALDAVNVLGRFLSFCKEDSVISQRLNEMLGKR